MPAIISKRRRYGFVRNMFTRDRLGSFGDELSYDYELSLKARVMHLLSAGAALLDWGGSGLLGCTSSISKLSNPANSSRVSGTSRAQTPNPEPLTVVQTTVPASSGTHSTVRSSKYGRAIHCFKPRLNGCTCLRSYLSPSSGCSNVRRWAADEIRGPNAARRRRSAGLD